MLAATMLAAFVAIVVIGAPLAVLIRARNHDDAVLELVQASTVASAQVSAAGDATDPIDLTFDSATITVGYFDAAGQLRAGNGPAIADAAVQEAIALGTSRRHTGAHELVVAVPVSANEQVFGAVRAAEPTSLIDGRTHRAWLTLAGIAGVALAVSAGVGALAARRLSRPVNRLRDDAVQLGYGTFAVDRQRSGIAEIDQATEALATTAARLHEVLARERAFSADASHQLRTPITSLRLALETERAAPRADPDEILAEALSDVDRLEHTIDSLLQLARDTPPDRAEIDLATVVVAAADRWRGALAGQARALRVDVPPAPVLLRVSTSALQHVLDVCLDNTVQHGAGPVTLAVMAGASSVTLSVSDEGPGIADPSAMFVRRGLPGGGSHGIGLALARSLVEAEGGRLMCARPGPHPRFDIVLLGEPEVVA